MSESTEENYGSPVIGSRFIGDEGRMMLLLEDGREILAPEPAAGEWIEIKDSPIGNTAVIESRGMDGSLKSTTRMTV